MGDIFKIKSSSMNLDKKEKKVKNLKEEIINFIAPFSVVKMKEISRHFKLPKSFVKQYIHALIESSTINGFLQKDLLMLSSFKVDEIDCPYCKKKINLNEI